MDAGKTFQVVRHNLADRGDKMGELNLKLHLLANVY